MHVAGPELACLESRRQETLRSQLPSCSCTLCSRSPAPAGQGLCTQKWPASPHPHPSIPSFVKAQAMPEEFSHSLSLFCKRSDKQWYEMREFLRSPDKLGRLQLLLLLCLKEPKPLPFFWAEALLGSEEDSAASSHSLIRGQVGTERPFSSWPRTAFSIFYVYFCTPAIPPELQKSFQ